MRRRPSGSLTEEDDEQLSSPGLTVAIGDADKGLDHLSDCGRASIGERDTRRRNNETISRTMIRKQPTPWNTTAQATATLSGSEREPSTPKLLSKDISQDAMVEGHSRRRLRLRNPWACSWLTLTTTVLALGLFLLIIQSFFTKQLDPKGSNMAYMRAGYIHFQDFDTEHTRFASKYSLYLYREAMIDDDPRVKGVPVLFIPGNAGSYKQVRGPAAEAAYHYHNVLNHDEAAHQEGKRPLDFFSVDFNEDITAFHGQTLQDQAEYLNDAVAYILSLYHDPKQSIRDPSLPDPTSVIILGHSMGGIVARTMLTMPNYQANSINTIITLSAPHARAPISFDGDIVDTYKRVNDYWRQAYSQTWASDNPLWQVTLISIAGGGLDTVVPSDYASLSSLVPETHGFTVFTSTIPEVWTGMDHLAITWGDQLRKSIVRALYDIINVNRPAQTKPRAERMRIFKRWFLTGLEDVAEKSLPHNEAKTLLTLEDDSNSVMSQGERLVLRKLGTSKKPKAYLLPIPPPGTPEGKKFTLLTDQKLDASGEHGNIEVLFCSVFPLQAGHSASVFSMNMDLSEESSGSTRLACKNAASDVIKLPASTKDSTHAFENRECQDYNGNRYCDKRPFSYLQYKLEELAEHQFVAVVDKAGDHTPGWVIAEFASGSETTIRTDVGLQRLLSLGLDVKLPVVRPMVVDVKIPALYSSLLAYNLHIRRESCNGGSELFTPLLRQYISEVHESKFFVNVKDANINLHGVAPYMPPSFMAKAEPNGLSLQIWSDPTCNSTMDVSLRVDTMGSMGKLWMRYRTIFAAFPLVVVALVLRKQHKVYDDTGIFMSFSESLNQCLRSSIPVLFTALTFLGMALAGADTEAPKSQSPHWFPCHYPGNATETAIDYTKNDLLLGSQDPFFWFLVPMFGLISIGICVVINYLTLAVTHILAFLCSLSVYFRSRSEDTRRSLATFAVTSTRRRVITTTILLFLVAFVIPYHFAYIVLCFVQLATCTRAYCLARENTAASDALALGGVGHYNFYNYTHSILVTMLWILPINIPVLVVWIRNLAVHWMVPFSTHHNVLSVMPFILLVEMMTTGCMIPRVTTRLRHVTDLLLFAIALYAGVYGVTYAYLLHHAANVLAAWLVAVHLTTSDVRFSIRALVRTLQGGEPPGEQQPVLAAQQVAATTAVVDPREKRRKRP